MVIYRNNSTFCVKLPDLLQLTSEHSHLTTLNSEKVGTFLNINASSLRDLRVKDLRFLLMICYIPSLAL